MFQRGAVPEVAHSALERRNLKGQQNRWLIQLSILIPSLKPKRSSEITQRSPHAKNIRNASGIIIIDNATHHGYLTYIGSADFNRYGRRPGRWMVRSAVRQPGSTLKPCYYMDYVLMRACYPENR